MGEKSALVSLTVLALLLLMNYSPVIDLEDGKETNKVIQAATNVLGFQEGSVYTNQTLSVSYDNGCIILVDQTVSCWGRNFNGNVGVSGAVDRLPPTQIDYVGPGFVQINVASLSACGLVASAEVYCWGDVLGQDEFKPVKLSHFSNLDPVEIIVGKYFHQCAIKSSGNLSCWSSGNIEHMGSNNGRGQLGSNNTTGGGPFDVIGLPSSVISVATGQEHSCALTDMRDVYCWGAGQTLGQENIQDSYTPLKVGGFPVEREVVSLSAGTYHTCALLDNGSVMCWGMGTYGQLGNLKDESSQYPVFVDWIGGSKRAISISAAAGTTCAILNDNSMVCWGSGHQGQLGNGSSNLRSNFPVNVSGFNSTFFPVGISNGGPLVCSLNNDATVSCWGDGAWGALGRDDETDSNVPRRINSPGKDVAISERDFDGDGLLNIFDTILILNCPPGEYGKYFCEKSPPGYRSPGSTMNPYECDLGTFQPSHGKSDCLYADLGHYVDTTGSAIQIPCEIGTYNPDARMTNSSSCINAQPGHYVDQIGQASQSPCAPGTYNPESGSVSYTDCFDAEEGHFVQNYGQSEQLPCLTGESQNETGQTRCVPCPSGQYQSAQGQTSCIYSSPGHYVKDIGQLEQLKCDFGSYQPNSGATGCIITQPGTYADEKMLTAPKLCSKGSYQTDYGQDRCIDASSGYFVDAEGSSSQTACEIGSFNPDPNSYSESDCVKSTPGYYVPEYGSFRQFVCLAGTYSTAFGTSECEKAAPGYYVSKPGQILQTECQDGTYSQSEAAVECTVVPAGYYSNTNKSVRLMCPDKTYTNTSDENEGKRSLSIDDCKPDFDRDRIIDEIDEDDDNDLVLDVDDDYPLDFERSIALSNVADESNANNFILIITVLGLCIIPIIFKTVFRKKEINKSKTVQSDGEEINQTNSPDTSKQGVIGSDGYEWIEHPVGTGYHYYRAPQEREWLRWDE